MATTTPSPPSSIRTPTTPRYGAREDEWEPYSPVRKSARVSAQRAQRDAKTPPPQLSTYNLRTAHSSPPSTTKRSVATSMPTSPPSTIAKKRTSLYKDNRQVSGALSNDNMTSTAASLGFPQNKGNMEAPGTINGVRNQGMLPTPDKTPKKRPSQAPPGINAIARNLFPVRHENVEEAMPTPKKRNKKYSGYTLDSFASEEEAPIAIFTDSQDRVPEIDLSADNPFYGVGAAVHEPTNRASKRRKISIPGEGEVTVEEAEKRKDGMILLFRGKKIFRKFNDDDSLNTSFTQNASDVELDDELDATVPARLRGPLTRSSIRPRLLFPTAEQVAQKEKKSLPGDDEDEEAVTDIEDARDFNTPSDLAADKFMATPKAPKFAPASPPTTVRKTRSKKVDMVRSGTPDEQGHEAELSGMGDSLSPFAERPRSKTAATKPGNKRAGERITRSGGDITKRQRAGPAS